jgi:hypothetical protein
MGVVIVKYTHPIARVLKIIKVRVGRGATFGVGVTASFVASLPAVGSRAPTLLCRGGWDCWVVATLSIPQGVCSLHHGCSHLMGASSYRFSHGMRQADQKHGKEKIVVRRNSWRKMLLELPHENTRFSVLHFHGEAEQFKIGLPLTLSKLPKQSFFQIVERLRKDVADI